MSDTQRDRTVNRADLFAEGSQADRAKARLAAARQVQLDLDVGLQAFAENRIEGILQ